MDKITRIDLNPVIQINLVKSGAQTEAHRFEGAGRVLNDPWFLLCSLLLTLTDRTVVGLHVVLLCIVDSSDFSAATDIVLYVCLKGLT